MALLWASDVSATKLATTAAVLAVMGALWLFTTINRARRRLRLLQKEGKPMVSYSWLLGHLPAIGSIFSRLPPGAHTGYVFRTMAEEASAPAIYFDSWPLSDPLLVIRDPRLAAQAMSHPVTGVDKPPVLRWWARAISGGPNVFDSNGPAWRAAHDAIAPAFGPANLAAELPLLLDGIDTLRERLRERAVDGRRFLLEPVIMRFVTDVMGRFLLNINLDTQNRPHPLADAMMRQLRLKDSTHQPSHLLLPFNPLLKFQLWNNGRILDGQIRAQLRRRFRQLRRLKGRGGRDGGDDDGDGDDDDYDDQHAFRSVMDLAIEEYVLRPGKESLAELDDEFMVEAACNMRMLFFVSYDSTSSLITYCLHAAFAHPAVLVRLRAEHGAALGHNPATAAQAILDDPAVLGRLPYTTAVIRETMRMWPPAGCIHDGCPDLVLVDPDTGMRFPTEGVAVYIDHLSLHHNPRYWPRPSEFLPDRFLVPDGDELRPPPDAWRPFEYGPRSCLGQQVVTTEVRAVLACLVRAFDLEDCYGEVDAEAGRAPDLTAVGGERVYLTEAGSAHPIGGYPCRIRVAGG